MKQYSDEHDFREAPGISLRSSGWLLEDQGGFWGGSKIFAKSID